MVVGVDIVEAVGADRWATAARRDRCASCADGGNTWCVHCVASTWGSLSAVVVMLTWLWLSSLALLFGAEVNAEAERSRELRRGEPAEIELQAPSKN